MTDLPEKVSDLIRVALADLIKCEGDERYDVNMSFWHTPYTDDAGEPVCAVCLGGSVLVQTLQVPFEAGNSEALAGLSDWNRSRILALNDIRCGALLGAASTAGYPSLALVRKIQFDFSHKFCPYEVNATKFKAYLTHVADELEKIGC